MNHSPPGTGTVKDDWSDGGGEAAPGQFVVLWDRETQRSQGQQIRMRKQITSHKPD